MLDYASNLPSGYAIEQEEASSVAPGSLSPPPQALSYAHAMGPSDTANFPVAENPSRYQSAISPSEYSNKPARRRVTGAPAARRRVKGAPTASSVSQRRSSVAGVKLPKIDNDSLQSTSHKTSSSNENGESSTFATPAKSPFGRRRISLVASPAINKVLGVGHNNSSPARRRIKGAPMPMRKRQRPSAFAAAGSVLAHSKYSVKSTEENMKKFREEMEKGLSQMPASPKGAQKWGRVKQRVQWQEGDSCAVCMARELTGRVKPCGHRSMCESCYNEVLSEGRGVYCPSCFSEVERLLPDSVSSSDNEGGSDEDVDWSSFRSPLADRSQAKLHLRASMAGTKLDRPELFGTTSVEIAQAFGTGIGTMFLHMGILFVLMVALSVMCLPIILANSGGVRKSSRRTLNPSPLVSTTLGNCGSSSCNVGEKWYVVAVDAAALCLVAVMSVWARARIAIFQAQVGDDILGVAHRIILVQNLNSSLITSKDVERYFARVTGVLATRADFLFDVEAKELALMQKRRIAATQLRIADAKIEWGDETSSCAGECVSEEEFGHIMKPRLERKLQKIEKQLQQMETCPSSVADAFVWFETAEDRDRALAKIVESISEGSGEMKGSDTGYSGKQACRILHRIFCGRGRGCQVERSMGGYAGCLSRCLSFSPGGKTFPLGGLSKGSGMSESSVHVHPALFPANVVHRNMGVSVGEQLFWRIASVILMLLVVGLSTSIYHSVRAPRGGGAASIENRNVLQAVLLLLVNACVPYLVRLFVRQQRSYLKTEENDAACALSVIMTSCNVLYFALYSALYHSGDGGLARWENMFDTHWYDEGGGDVMHYYLLLDAAAGPFLIVARAGYQKWHRRAKLSKAVCQEQLNQAHVGIQLDFLCEYATSLVAPAVATVLSCGLPLLPTFAAIGLLLKMFALRYVLFFEAAVPLWRDGMLVRWGCGVMQAAVLAHFFMASAMIVSADQVDFVASEGTELHSGGLYIIHPIALLAVATFMLGAKCVSACIGRKVLSRTSKNSKVLNMRKTRSSDISERFGSSKLPKTKEARDALERVRAEREAALQETSESEDSAATSSDNSSDDGASSSGLHGSRERKYSEDLTNADEFKRFLKLLDEQAERAWSADLVVDPESYESFDAAEHPFFGAEVGLRRSVRSVARSKARQNFVELQRREAEIANLEREASTSDDMTQSARQKVISHKLLSNHGGTTQSKSNDDSSTRSKKEAQAVEAKMRLTAYMARAKKIKAKRKSLKAESRKPRQRRQYGGQGFVA